MAKDRHYTHWPCTEYSGSLGLFPVADKETSKIPAQSKSLPSFAKSVKEGWGNRSKIRLLFLAGVFVDRSAFHYEIYVLEHLHIR